MFMPRLPTRPIRRAVLFPLAVGASLTALPVAAQGPANANVPLPQPMREHDHQRGHERRALADAVRRVERATRGEVLSAERVPFDGRDVSRVKVVDASGRVRIYMDDPQARREPPPNRTRRNDGNSD
jgi:type IV secretory pathway protease TraF